MVSGIKNKPYLTGIKKSKTKKYKNCKSFEMTICESLQFRFILPSEKVKRQPSRNEVKYTSLAQRNFVVNALYKECYYIKNVK